jgi:hypothetical protein
MRPPESNLARSISQEGDSTTDESSYPDKFALSVSEVHDADVSTA